MGDDQLGGVTGDADQAPPPRYDTVLTGWLIGAIGLAGVVAVFLLVALANPALALWLRRRGSRPSPRGWSSSVPSQTCRRSSARCRLRCFEILGWWRESRG